MPHRRYPSAEPCEIVPGPDEFPCVQPGYGERPRLCGTHRREYSRTTKTYKTTSDEAEALYKRVRARDWTDRALWNLEDVEEAIGVAQACIATTEKEIRERQEHHRRFFTERTSSVFLRAVCWADWAHGAFGDGGSARRPRGVDNKAAQEAARGRGCRGPAPSLQGRPCEGAAVARGGGASS